MDSHPASAEVDAGGETALIGDAVADGESAAAVTGDGAASAESAGSDEGPTCGGKSFSAGTLVLLASGKAEPISSLKVGDKVLANNIKTGKNQIETISAVWVHHDTDLYNLRIKTSHGAELIHTTSNHPFWDPAKRQWVEAAGDGAGLTLVPADAALLVHNSDSPVGPVFRYGAYRLQIYSNDHGPAHDHLQGPDTSGDGIQIGQNGKPLDPDVTLTPAQQKVIDNNIGAIRKSIGKYMSWYKANCE